MKRLKNNILKLNNTTNTRGFRRRAGMALGKLKVRKFSTRKVSTNKYNKIILSFASVASTKTNRNMLTNHLNETAVFSKVNPLFPYRSTNNPIRFRNNVQTLLGFNLKLKNYKYITHYKYARNDQILNLNFRHSKFFPSIRSFKTGLVFVTLSLGLFWKYFFKPKAFKKNKTMYLTSASFLRKILLYCSLTELHLHINRTPRYFNEILNKLNEPSISTYNHPFNPQVGEVVEGSSPDNFTFSSIMFTSNKNYGQTKLRKRGRLKRKIFRRLVTVNRVLD